MLTQALIFLLETFMGLFALALLVRFYMQLLRAPARNPLTAFLVALTNWLVVPARRVIPGMWRLDLSTLVLAWVTEVLLLSITFWLRGFDFGPALGMSLVLLGLLGAVAIIKLTLYILMAAVIVQAVLSWVAPYSPAMPLLNSFSSPFLGVFQKRIPPVGNVDLSPIFVIVSCQLLLYAVAWAEGALIRGVG